MLRIDSQPLLQSTPPPAPRLQQGVGPAASNTVTHGSRDDSSASSTTKAKQSPGAEISTVLLVGCYSSFASMYMLVSFVAPFFPAMAKKWGLGSASIGFICSCDAIGEVLSTAFATFVMARYGAAKSAVVGQILNGISSLLFGLVPMVTRQKTTMIVSFVTLRLLNGAATNITYIAVMAVLCNLMPDKTGSVTSNIAVLTTIGLTAGPPFGGALISFGHKLTDSLNLDEDSAENWQFATPFAGATLVLLAPTWVLWQARHDAEGAKGTDQGDSEGDDEEEEVSFSEELRRMKSIVNRTTLACILAITVISIGQDARDPVLGPHLSSRCDDDNVLEGEHFPFNYGPMQISLVFASGSIAFLPLSIYIGAQADARERDFAWLRRCMAMGLGCQALAFMLMGPAPVLPIQTMRKLETGACMVFSQVTLGIGNALTLIAGFPFLEGACEVTGNAKLTQPQRIAVAGTWYNAAFSFGCAMGPLITGTLQEYIPFADTLFLLSMISVVAIGVVVLDGVTDRKATGGFLANNLSTTEHSVKVWNSMGDKFRDWAMSESAGDGTELHEYNSGPGTVADLRQSLSSHVGSEAISSTPIGRTSLSSPSQSTQTRRKGVNAIRAALINEILAAEMGWEDGAEEKQRKRQPLSYAYNLLLVVVAVVVVGCLVATVVEGDKEPCRPFYAEKSAIYGCSNRLTVGLFTDDYHMRHCHSLHSRTANASTNMRYYPHPPDNPTGCVLVRTNPDTDCVMGDIDKKARTCLC